MSFSSERSNKFGRLSWCSNCASDDGKKAWLGQLTIIKSLEKQFGEKVAKKKMTITPVTPGLIGGKVDDISKVDEKT